MDSILTQLSQIGIVPVIQLDRAEDAVPLAKALMAGGLPCAEITFRTGKPSYHQCFCQGQEGFPVRKSLSVPPQGKRLSGTSAKRFRRCWWAPAQC